MNSWEVKNNINHDSAIYVAGHLGLAGSALVRRLKQSGYHNIITRSPEELDLTQQTPVLDFISEHKPDYIFLAAAKVGGIRANSTYPADFIYQNLAIEMNVINAAHHANVDRLMFLGSNCIYPRDCPQPMQESYLLNGPLEPTSEPYSIAKLAGIKLCESFYRQHGRKFLVVMPTDLYGPNDNFDLKNSHVLPALLRKIHEAKESDKDEVIVWGTGNPQREFLHADDMADACLFLMERGIQSGIYNLGTGLDVTITELAELIKTVVDHDCELRYDGRYPDGTRRKLSDIFPMLLMMDRR